MSGVNVFSPKQCGHTEGFLRSGLRPGGSGLRPGVHSRWYHTCSRFWMTHTAQKFPHLPFSKDVLHEMVAGRPLFRRARFTGAPCSFFELCPFRVWQARHFRDVLKSETSFCVTGAGHRALFHPCGRRGVFCTLLKRWQAWVKMRCV